MALADLECDNVVVFACRARFASSPVERAMRHDLSHASRGAPLQPGEVASWLR